MDSRGVFIITSVILMFLIIINVISGQVRPTINILFEKYNQKDFEYICNNLTTNYHNHNRCIEVWEQYYDDYGKELSYSLTIFTSRINIVSNSSGSSQEITNYVKFEKEPRVEMRMHAIVNKNGDRKITILQFNPLK